MVKTLLKLYAANVATADNIASAIIPQTGVITSCSWSFVGATSGTAGARATYQLSIQSTSQFQSNDARNIIDEFAATSDCVTTTISCGTNKNTPIAGVKVNAGDKIYLHVLVGVAFGAAQCNLAIQIV